MQRITITKGDGIGPEIMDATLNVLRAAGAQLEYDEIELGEKVYLSGNSSGIHKNDWETIRKNKVLLKAPITTPQGGGYKSLNVTIRKSLGLFANVRPCLSYSPFIKTKHPELDVVVIRENEEDLYAGIEHRQTDEVMQCLKLITRPGCERIIRYAFEFAKVYGRKKVSCFVKDNIMKHTDGLFHDVFKEIAADYPDIKSDSWIVDIGTARVADTPELFDVIVTPNLYGDIISDVTAQISGSVGMSGTSNIGEQCAMFEAIHGSAPDIAGKDIANPSGLILASVMMLNHIGQAKIAEKIKNAWSKTIEDGIHTTDIFNEKTSSKKVGTKEFALEVIKRLGSKPKTLKSVSYAKEAQFQMPRYKRRPAAMKSLKGVDVFVDWKGIDADELAARLNRLTGDIQLTMITNRGVKVWPEGFPETFRTDHWRCRFETFNGDCANKDAIPKLLQEAIKENIDVIKTENLYEFDGVRGFSLGQGQ